MGERGRIKRQDGEEAMSAVVTAIRTTEQSGEISLIPLDDEEEDNHG